MAAVLIAYSTVDGHTREIAERLASQWRTAGDAVTLVSLDADAEVDPAAFDRVVIGASIRYGKHRPNVADYINRHADALQARPGAFFSVNLVARKPNRKTASSNPYVRRFLATIRWRPDIVEVFAGKLDYPSYRFWDRQVIRLIMWVTKGPTEPTAVVDYTDWAQVEGMRDRLLAAVGGGAAT